MHGSTRNIGRRSFLRPMHPARERWQPVLAFQWSREQRRLAAGEFVKLALPMIIAGVNQTVQKTVA